jgi:hypothetical protein
VKPFLMNNGSVSVGNGKGGVGCSSAHENMALVVFHTWLHLPEHSRTMQWNLEHDLQAPISLDQHPLNPKQKGRSTRSEHFPGGKNRSSLLHSASNNFRCTCELFRYGSLKQKLTEINSPPPTPVEHRKRTKSCNLIINN